MQVGLSALGLDLGVGEPVQPAGSARRALSEPALARRRRQAHFTAFKMLEPDALTEKVAELMKDCIPPF